MTELEKTRHFFDEKAEIWDNHECKEKEQRLYKIFSKKITELNSPILDMGSGTGILVPILEKIIQPPDHIVEFDISKSMLNSARSKFHFKENVNFVQSDAHMLPFQSQSFSTVVCFAVFPHLTDQIKAIREFNRVLTEGGMLIVLHLMGHRELNAMHEEAGTAVCRHALLPVDNVSKQIASESFKIFDYHEREDLYLIVAQKQQN